MKRTIVYCAIGILAISIFVYFVYFRRVGADVITSEGLAIYNVSPFDSILPSSTPAGSPATQTEVNLYKNENGIFSLAIRNTSPKSLNLTTSISALTLGDISIPGNRIDERVVNVWNQKIINWSRFPRSTSNQLTPELLVKNDRRDFSSFTLPLLSGSSNVINIGALTNTLLSVKKSDPIDTVVASGQTKQFVFKVDKLQDAGTFSSQLQFINKATSRTVGRIDLKLKVNDISLVEPSDAGYTIGCYYNDSLAFRKTISKDRFEGKEFDRMDQYYLNPSGTNSDIELLKTRLKTMRDYGCESVRIYADPYTDVIDGNSYTALYVQTIQALGFTGPIIINFGKDTNLNIQNVVITDPNNDSVDRWFNPLENFKKIVREVKKVNVSNKPIYFYGVDECNNEAEYELQKQKVANMQSAISQVDREDPTLAMRYPLVSSKGMTSATYSTFNRLKAEGKLPTLPIENIISPKTLPPYTATTPYINDFIQNAAYRPKAQVNPNEGYYFQGFNEDPKMNRFLGGLFLTGTNLNSYYINNIYSYGGLAPANTSDLVRRESSRKPYNDFFGASWTEKRQFIFYPSADGFIPTIQSEAWREGVMDIKVYLKAKDAASKAAMKCSKPNFTARVQAVQAKYKTTNTNFSYASIPLTSKNMEDNRKELDLILTEIKTACPAAL